MAVNNDPPRIIISRTPAVLVSIDGKSVLRPSAGGFMKVINSRALQDALEARGAHTRVMTALEMERVAECGVGRPAQRGLRMSREKPAIDQVEAERGLSA